MCAYPRLRSDLGGGSRIELFWAESLYHAEGPHNKGNRNEVEDKLFRGDGDTFLPAGLPALFSLLWWRAGRYVEVFIETGDEELRIEELSFSETRYPLENTNGFTCDDARVLAPVPLMTRCLQACAHETYMDCPYYEQLMYVGDTRLEVLATYVLTPDARLPRKAICMFDWSRLPSGLTQSRYPCSHTQVIPGFSLWWVCMVRDYMLWRDEPEFVTARLRGVRAVMDGFDRYMTDEGLLGPPQGWNYVDWVREWEVSPAGPHTGEPPGIHDEPNGIMNLQWLLALQSAAALEKAYGSPEIATLFESRSRALAERIRHVYWNDQHGLFAFDPAGSRFAEHTQCLAVLAGVADPAQQARIATHFRDGTPMDRTTWYFSHYLFETLPRVGAMDLFMPLLERWIALPEQGFTALPESPDPCRSDCHAWSAHPLYHYVTKLLGVTPGAAGFKRVRVEPRPCHLNSLSARLPHPRGHVDVALRVEGDSLSARIGLPEGISGVLVWRGAEYALQPGEQSLEC
jgi:hypothetical protein